MYNKNIPVIEIIIKMGDKLWDININVLAAINL